MITIACGDDEGKLSCRVNATSRHNRRLYAVRTMLAIAFVGLLAVVATFAGAVKTDYPTPAATYEARDYTNWNLHRVGKSRKALVDVRFTAADGSEDYVTVTRLDLVGNAYDRGYAQGQLLHEGNVINKTHNLL